MTPEIINTPKGPPDLPHIRTMQSNTLHALARVTHSLLGCKNPRPLEPQLSGKENLDSGCGNESPTTSPAAKMKFTIPFPNDNNATKGTYFSSSSSTCRVIAIIEGWSWDKCTFQHSYPAQICAMCNANRNDEDKDDNATGAYSSSYSARSATMTALKREWPLADEKDYATKKRPSRVAKKTVSYCNTSNSELDFDKDGYEQSNTR